MTQPRLPNTKRPTIGRALRDRIDRRDGSACVYCGRDQGLVYDHVFPFAQGGSTTYDNLVVACGACNALAGDRVFPELNAKREWIQWARPQFTLDELEAMAWQLAAVEGTLEGPDDRRQ